MKTEIITICVLLALGIFYVSSFTGLFIQIPATYAMRIIDGDTIEISGGEKVRLLGIDTPEKGQHFYEQAKQRLTELIGGKEIILETDRTDRDKYSRLLRYIYVNRTELVNTILVREGLASVLIIPPDNQFEEELLKLESEARSKGIGIWEFSDAPDMFCIGIYYFKYNAMGDDRKNVNDEYVEFRNKCIYPMDLGGWSVIDGSGRKYIFGDFAVQNKTVFRLRSGEGNNTADDLYWGNRQPVWNNAGDSMLMKNAEGDVVLNYTYKGYA